MSSSEWLQMAEESIEQQVKSTAVLYCRLDPGNSSETLDLMMRALKQIAEEKGFRIMAMFGEVNPGDSLELEHRPELAKAINIAKKIEAPLVMASPSSLLRPASYHPVLLEV